MCLSGWYCCTSFMYASLTSSFVAPRGKPSSPHGFCICPMAAAPGRRAAAGGSRQHRPPPSSLIPQLFRRANSEGKKQRPVFQHTYFFSSVFTGLSASVCLVFAFARMFFFFCAPRRDAKLFGPGCHTQSLQIHSGTVTRQTPVPDLPFLSTAPTPVRPTPSLLILCMPILSCMP